MQNNQDWKIINLGLREYHEVWELQKDLVELRSRNKIPDLLLFLEHPPVITLGKKGTMNDVFTTKIPVIKVERGGKATYHGPGQLVVYFIINLASDNLQIGQLLTFINQWLLETFNSLKIETVAGTGAASGIWTKNKQKLVSIGLSVRKNITFHGIAINIQTNLKHFQYLDPCGYSSNVMTSLAALGYKDISVSSFQKLLMNVYTKLTGKSLVYWDWQKEGGEDLKRLGIEYKWSDEKKKNIVV